MMLTQAQKKQILDKVEACYVKCEAHYKRTFQRPSSIRFDLSGSTAGTANPTTHVLRFQPVLAAGHWDDFLNDTVPHEVAHLIDYDVNNKLVAQQNARMNAHLNNSLFGFGRRVRRPKRDIHGDSWRAVMRVLGINGAARCHQYDTSNVARRKSRHEYRCGCGEVLSVGPKHHNAIQRGAKITHKSCRGALTAAMLVGLVPRAPVAIAAQTPAPKAPQAPGAGTKMQRAVAIVNANATLGAAGTIAIIMRELDMSKAGAQTYYYTARKQR